MKDIIEASIRYKVECSQKGDSDRDIIFRLYSFVWFFYGWSVRVSGIGKEGRKEGNGGRREGGREGGRKEPEPCTC